jgi:hypothetical protein
MKNVVLPHELFILSGNEIDLLIPGKQLVDINLKTPDLVVGQQETVLSADSSQPYARRFQGI